MKVKIEYEIHREDIKGILISAMQGINYWCDSFDGDFDLIIDGKLTAKVHDYYEDQQLFLDNNDIYKGIQIMAAKYPKHFNDFISQEYDMVTGDVFLQCCLFKDIIYS